jgi:5-(carboxyamino)imidazole ribonucleotide mutase
MNKVGIILGSKSDFDVAKKAIETLESLTVDYDFIISSAHRSPDRTIQWTINAEKNNIKVIIAIAGAAAHLAGVVAAHTTLPVIAVPVSSTTLGGFDALLSSVQMPAGVPVATMAIGSAGAVNAAIFATQILSLADTNLKEKFTAFKKDLSLKVEKDNSNILKNLHIQH